MAEENRHKTTRDAGETTKKTWRDKLIPNFLWEYVVIWRQEGFRALIKKKGWKFVIIIVTYYLIRDSILYILIPYLIARGVFS